MSEEKKINEHLPGTEDNEATQSQPTEGQAKNENKEIKPESKKTKKDKSARYLEQLEEEKEKSEKLAKDIEDLKNRHIRLQAEFDNFRKRTLKEKMDLLKTGGESVLSNILPVIDDFERAMATLEPEKDNNPVKAGIVLIYNKFLEFLKNNGIREIEATGKELDTDLHEAVTKTPAADEMKGKIVDVIQKGYLLNDKVIRFAKVVIGE